MATRLLVVVCTLLAAVAAFAQKKPASAKPSAKPSAAAVKVTAVHLTVGDAFKNYSGACPVRVIFSGSITANGKATVPYTFESSDGTGFTGHRMEFAGPGTKSLQQPWEIRKDFSGWLALKPGAPFNNVSSTRAFFKVKCTSQLHGK